MKLALSCPRGPACGWHAAFHAVLLGTLAVVAACSGASAPEAGEPEPALPEASEPEPAPEALAPVAAPPRSRVHEGSSIARSTSENALYVADEDHLALRRVALPIEPEAVPTEIAMPGAPAQVLALADALLVTIRDPGLLLVLRPVSSSEPDAAPVEIARIALPADAWGVAVTPDEKTALVTSAWTHRVSAVDLETGTLRWSVDVGREPRGVVVRADGAAAYVTHLVGAGLTRIDGIDGAEPVARALRFDPAPLRTPRQAQAEAAELDASLAYAATLSPDGARLFVPRHALGALGKRSWFGQATVDVLLTADDTALVPPRRRDHVGVDLTEEVDLDVTLSSDGAVPVQERAPFAQPRAVVYRRATRTLLVAGEGDDTIAELDALALDPSLTRLGQYRASTNPSFAKPGALGCTAPSGLALSDDESTVFAYCRTSDSLAAFPLDPPHRAKGWTAPPAAFVRLAASPLDDFTWKLPPQQTKKVPPEIATALGRRMFYAANDYQLSEGLGCAGCHPDGRDDGHVHQEVGHGGGGAGLGDFLQFSLAGGPIRGPAAERGTMITYRGHPRQTPMLAGRVDAAGPYGWHGESSTLERRIEASFDMHRWSGVEDSAPRVEEAPFSERTLRAAAIALFLRRGLVPPPHEVRALTTEEEHGKALFSLKSTGCAGCHAPETGYTDRIPIALGEVDDVPGVLAEPESRLFKTPSLRFVGSTAPYFHDGRAPTLEALIDDNHDHMGHTDHLSRRDRAALIAFLRTL